MSKGLAKSLSRGSEESQRVVKKHIDDNVITDDEDGTFVITGTVDVAYIVIGCA